MKMLKDKKILLIALTAAGYWLTIPNHNKLWGLLHPTARAHHIHLHPRCEFGRAGQEHDETPAWGISLFGMLFWAVLDLPVCGS